MTISATRREAMCFDIDTSGHTITVDADSAHGGEDRGPSPKSLMLTALAGCTGMDVTAILNKMQMPYDSFQIEIEADSADEHPRVYTEVRIRYIFSGGEVDTGKVEKAVHLSLTKYCPVAATLKHTAEITSEVVHS